MLDQMSVRIRMMQTQSTTIQDLQPTQGVTVTAVIQAVMECIITLVARTPQEVTLTHITHLQRGKLTVAEFGTQTQGVARVIQLEVLETTVTVFL